MSLRILRTAGPTKASPTGCARGGPLEQPNNKSRAAAQLTFDMEPTATPAYEFTRFYSSDDGQPMFSLLGSADQSVSSFSRGRTGRNESSRSLDFCLHCS